MRVLVVGSGGREHALCWAIAASALCEAVFCAPGNAGIAEDARCLPVPSDDITGLVALARGERGEARMDFVVVGPEGPLAAGLVDALEAAGIPAFGPTRAAAILESSKGWMKDFCARHAIPTAGYARFDQAEAALSYLTRVGAPVVVKADGLASGKGVTVAMTSAEAEEAVRTAMLGARFGAAGREVVIEEFMEGEEVSLLALCDGRHLVPLASAQDHKRVGEGDTGLNTGGMGAYSPAPVLTAALQAQAMREILEPALAGMAAEGRPFKGVLYAGLMLTATGPRLVEFNVRFGDPETQVLLMRLKSDLLTALIAARDGALDTLDLRWRDTAALTVVMAAEGYPGTPRTGTPIAGLEALSAARDVKVFHAATRRAGDRIVAEGGRVLAVTALGRDIAAAQLRAYQAVDCIDWPGGFCRRDIGWRAVRDPEVPTAAFPLRLIAVGRSPARSLAAGDAAYGGVNEVCRTDKGSGVGKAVEEL